MNERSGVVNIGIEGMMLAERLRRLVRRRRSRSRPLARATPSAFFGVTPALLIGVVAAIADGHARCRALHAWLSISVRADQIISGTIINIAALGVTGYLNLLLSRNLAADGAASSSAFEPPAVR